MTESHTPVLGVVADRLLPGSGMGDHPLTPIADDRYVRVLHALAQVEAHEPSAGRPRMARSTPGHGDAVAKGAR